MTCVDSSDWSRAVSPPGAPGVIPYYRSNVEILGHFAVILSLGGAMG